MKKLLFLLLLILLLTGCYKVDSNSGEEMFNFAGIPDLDIHLLYLNENEFGTFHRWSFEGAHRIAFDVTVLKNYGLEEERLFEKSRNEMRKMSEIECWTENHTVENLESGIEITDIAKCPKVTFLENESMWIHAYNKSFEKIYANNYTGEKYEFEEYHNWDEIEKIGENHIVGTMNSRSLIYLYIDDFVGIMIGGSGSQNQFTEDIMYKIVEIVKRSVLVNE